MIITLLAQGENTEAAEATDAAAVEATNIAQGLAEKTSFVITGNEPLDTAIVSTVIALAIALLLLVVGFVVAGFVSQLIGSACRRAKLDETLARFFGKMAKYAVLGLTVIVCLDVAGIPATSFAALVAAAGFAVGMALQGTLGNFASGVMLLVFRPFKVGDVVNTGGVTGKVFEIDLFSTVMDTPDNRRIIVPNGAVFGSTIENITFHPTRRVDVAVGTDYGAETETVREILLKAASNVEGRLEDEDVTAALVGLGASSIDWSVRVWSKTEDFFAVKDALTRDIKKALDEAGVGIPFPQMDVHVQKTDA